MRSGVKGISLVETILCLSLVTIAALGLIAALTRLMVAQSSSSHQTVARILADSILQKVVLDARPIPNSDPPDVDGYDFGTIQTFDARVGQNAELVSFSCIVEKERLVPTDDFKLDSSGQPMPVLGHVWEFKATVWWNNDSSHEGAVERGTETIEVTTLSYVEI